MLDAATTVRISFLRWLIQQDSTRRDGYTAYREYYDGDHDTQLTSRQRKFLQVKTGIEFNDNYCPLVVDAVTDRLEVMRFETSDDVEEPQSQVLWEWWQRNRMDQMQQVAHLAAVRDGDAYVLVDWDEINERPRFTFEPAYNGSGGVEIVYGKERRGVASAAFKYWRAEKEQLADAGYVRRMNIYYPDRIEKYISDERAGGGQWASYQPEGDAWPLWWTSTGTEGGEPLGIPVFHFRNKDQGYDYGQSELRNVVTLQNALNKAIIDLVAAADTTGFRLYWMTGNKPGSLDITPGNILYSQNPDTRMGYFPGEDLSSLIATKDSYAMEIARVSRTPLSYFQSSGQRPAEGTLKQEEQGLVAKVKTCQVGFGNVWEDAMAMARRLWNIYGPRGEGLDESVLISTLWQDAESRNEKAKAEELKIKLELGVPEEQLWREWGYTDVEVEQFKEIKAEQGGIGDKILRAFETQQGFNA